MSQRQKCIQDCVNAKKESTSGFLLKFVLIQDVALSCNILETLFIQATSQPCSEIQDYSTAHKLIVVDRVAQLIEKAEEDQHYISCLTVVKSFLHEEFAY